LTTNQPSPLGASPDPVSTSCASGIERVYIVTSGNKIVHVVEGR
jgi:hypothetical protein